MTQDRPGYYYVIPTRGDGWAVWMWTGQHWYQPGVADAQDPPFKCHIVPQPPRLDTPDYYHVIMDGYGNREKLSGDVITKDGEIIGTWVLDPEDHPGFIPLGEAEQVIWSPWIGEFCKLVAQWHELRETQKLISQTD